MENLIKQFWPPSNTNLCQGHWFTGIESEQVYLACLQHIFSMLGTPEKTVIKTREKLSF